MAGLCICCCGAGEWLLGKHGTKMRHSWRTLHIGMDANTGEIIAAEMTTNDADDAAQVEALLSQLTSPVASFTGDGAYERDGGYRSVIDRDPGAAVVVPPRTTAVPSETAEIEPTQRGRNAQCIGRNGRMAWQKASGYHNQSRVEVAIGVYRQLIGDGLRFRHDARRAAEVSVAVHVLNRMLQQGRSISVRITRYQMGVRLFRPTL
jgi:hypothetical protein